MSTEAERQKADIGIEVLADLASNGNTMAKSYLLQLSYMSRQLDDMIDKDHPVTDENIIRSFFVGYSGFQGNVFFNQMRLPLESLQVLIFNAWLDGDEIRDSGEEFSVAFSAMLGEMIMEAYILVAYYTGGFEHMRRVSRLVRGDTLETITKEVTDHA